MVSGQTCQEWTKGHAAGLRAGRSYNSWEGNHLCGRKVTRRVIFPDGTVKLMCGTHALAAQDRSLAQIRRGLEEHEGLGDTYPELPNGKIDWAHPEHHKALTLNQLREKYEVKVEDLEATERGD